MWMAGYLDRIDGKKKSWNTLQGSNFIGWGGRIRTCECGIQSPVPYQLGDSPVSNGAWWSLAGSNR